MTRMQQRGYPAAGWDPAAVLLEREIGIETDTAKWKLGDGTTAWSALPYQPSPADLVIAVIDGGTATTP